MHVISLVLLSFCICLTATHPTGRDSDPKTADEIEAHGQTDARRNHEETVDLDEEDGDIYEKFAEDSSSSIFQSILTNVRRGQVSKDSLSQWMTQIQNSMSIGTLSSQAVSRFMASLKEKLAGTPFVDTCCPLG